MDYTLRELMAIIAAREIKNGDIVFCGTGISMVAAMAAKHMNAPESIIFFETGAIDSALEEIPMAVADPRVMYCAASNGGLLDAFATMQNRITGERVIGILGAAQIDKFGNMNSTSIGDYYRPEDPLLREAAAPATWPPSCPATSSSCSTKRESSPRRSTTSRAPATSTETAAASGRA